MKHLLRISFMFLFGLVIITGCSKDEDDDNNKPPEVVSPEIQSKLDEINVPENLANSQTWYALQVSAYVAQIKSINSYFAYFDPVEGAEYDDGVYFWTNGGQSVWLNYTETSNTYGWEMDVDFGNGRVDYISAEQQKDGSSGWLRVYDYTESTTGNFIYEYNWEILGDDSVVLSWSNSEDGFNLEIKGSPDDSGYAKYFENNVPVYEFVWNSDGSGYYTTYDDTGELENTTNWTTDNL
ncbi:MAG: hypothetical protein ACOC3T_02225 [Bacteroidota bacterium]